MGIHRATAPAVFVLFLVVSMLTAAWTSFTAGAQIGTPPPSTGQVIAHGIDSLPGTSVTWRLGFVTAPPPGIDARFGSFDPGFAVGWEQPVIATQLPSGESAYLEPGQAVFHPSTSTLRVTSTTGVDEGFASIELTTDAPDPGASWIGDPFVAPSGTHDLRLTSDILAPNETATFAPANDLPYMVYVHAGSLQVTDANGALSQLATGEATQVTGAASLLAAADTGAHWMIASIGPQVDVPPLPTPVTTPATTPTATGSLVVQLLRCPDGTDPTIAPTECSLSSGISPSRHRVRATLPPRARSWSTPSISATLPTGSRTSPPVHGSFSRT
mgnify:CR=1 FL=1